MMIARGAVGAPGTTSSWVLARILPSVRGRVRDYLHLAKARLSLMVVFSAVVGYWLASLQIQPLALLLFTGGTFLLVAGANAFNQILERESDARMERTAHRPIPQGRITVGRATVAASVFSTSGLAILFLSSGPLAAALGLFALLLYVLVYTPMKRRSAWATLPGAISGAVPTLIGWSAAEGGLSAPAWCLFAFLFFWQFPHTWAIAAAYREDYERVGYRALPGRGLALSTFGMSLGLVATSLLPALFGSAGPAYTGGVLFLGVAFLAVAVRFGNGTHRPRAAALLGASLFYLPVVLALAVLDGRGF